MRVVTGRELIACRFVDIQRADFVVGLSRRAGLTWVGRLEPYARLQGLVTEPDRSYDRTLPSTGATRLYAVPGVALNLRPQRLRLSFELGLPVYPDYTSNQWGTGATWLVGMSYQL